MGLRDIKAGRAFVEILARNKLTAGLRSAQMQLRSFAGTTRRMGTYFTAAGVGLGYALTKPIMAASSAEQIRSRFGMVFGDQSDEAQQFVDSVVARLKRGEKDVQDAMASFQAQLRGRGFESEFARGLSEELTQLAIDFASFSDIADEEALQRFLSALSGETESLDRYGIDLHEAAMNAELLAMGIGKTVQQATEQEKTLARLSIIRKSMERMGAIDNAFVTRGEFANKLRVAAAAWDRLNIAIGESLMIVAPVVDGFSAFADTLALIVEQVPIVGPLLLGAAAGAVALGVALLMLSLAATAIGGVASALTLLLSPMGPIILAIAAIAAGLAIQAALLLAGVVAWALFTESGQRAMEALGAAWDVAFLGFQHMMGGILAALQKGDLETAANIALLGLTLGFATTFRNILKIVVDFVADAARELIKLLDYVPFAGQLGLGATVAITESAALAGMDALVRDLKADLDALIKAAHTDFGPIAKPDPDAVDAAAAGAAAARRQGQSIGTFSAAEVRQIARALGGSTNESREEKKVDLLEDIARNTKFGNSGLVFT